MVSAGIAPSSAGPFDHYLYVLACGDGSLYTGYTTDVAARVAAHQAGRGARYTRSHEPVRLIARARFYSKRRAMSAEARFKRLDRAEKDRLLALAAREPFEDVLRRELSGFGDDTAQEFVDRSLASWVDSDFARFQAGLIPTVDARAIVGVRTPELRRIARELVRRDDAGVFFAALPHWLFEEMQVHALAIGLERDYDKALALYRAFLPHIDNWATCDQLPVKVLAARPAETLVHVGAWLLTERCYPMRFAIRVLMALFLGERFELRFLEMVAEARLSAEDGAGEGMVSADDIYYLNMMRAWYFAEALVWQPARALPYLERRGEAALLDEWTRRKAIQKAVESRRVSSEMKQRLRMMRGGRFPHRAR